jgi:hypothetical protein
VPCPSVTRIGYAAIKFDVGIPQRVVAEREPVVVAEVVKAFPVTKSLAGLARRRRA